MGALSVLSHYYNDHLEMDLSDFYENPTAVQQARLLGRTGEKSQEGNADQRGQLSCQALKREKDTEIKVEWSLESEPVKPAAEEEQPDKDAVLVTGATGFFGAHLVKELLMNGQQRVICLMRDGDEERLKQCLSWYFGQGLIAGAANRLVTVKGDIALEHLGMTDTDYRQLAGEIFEIYHCAADVRHYAADEECYLNTNTGGTANMLELARLAQASFYHMSTCSVSGEQLKDDSEAKVFTEKDYDIGQVWEDNIYVKSKFLAEGLVLQAAEEGLTAKIFRLGRLVGRASDGVFQRNPKTNAFYLLMKGFCRIGAVPQMAAGAKIDLMPIDTCVEEVLALKNSDGMIYHIMSHDPPTLEEVVNALDEKIQIVSDFDFIRILEEKSQSLDRELLAMMLNYWRNLRVKKQSVSITNTLTMEALSKAGYCPKNPSLKQILQSFSM